MDDPVAMRRRLRTELKRLRTEAGRTQRQVAAALDWSPSKIMRIENGASGISTTDLRALIAHFGPGDPTDVEELVRLARYSRRLPYSDYRDVLSAEAIRLFGLEASASTIRQVHPLIIPGLLQTEEYTRAILRGVGREADAVNRLVESRRRRQELLEHGDAGPHYICILDEAVLRRPVGGPAAMRRQLEHLARLTTRSHVTVRVLPFEVGVHRGILGPFVVLEFADAADLPLLYLEDPRGSATFAEDPDVVTAFIEVFFDLELRAAPPEHLEVYVDRALREMATGEV